ncbi:hypothetical protein BN1723_003975 [Verticillium longisporum]|uniref:Uncharacterized protein n=1 Tax=Verticillium longisporum TaxID=100787 RepID=A0A0G4L0D8_VERLO|nr:hypothetical protein BN1708_011486 [Verticillium longisporum]CRK33308.1 hypothetical protein BN1723_003975 [Verticillium longisporum]
MFEEVQQHITAAEVNEASDLKRIGQQRLRDISGTVPTCFTFNVPLSSPEYDASVTIEVKPIVRENSLHPLYDILIHCEASSSSDHVDELAKKVQEVYDTYIQAVRWKFDRHCFEANPSRRRCTECPSLASEGSTMRQTLQQEPVCSPGSQSTEPTQFSSLTPLLVPTTPSTSGKRGPPSIVAEDSRPVKRPKARQTVDEVSRGLISTISKGLKMVQKKDMFAFDQSNMQHIFSKCLQANLSGPLLDKFLLTLASEFRKRMRHSKHGARLAMWSDWYFSACLQYARCRTGIKERNHDQDRSSNAVYVLHSIVNNLLFSDGISALSVIAAVAACGQVLSAAAHRTAQEQELIIETVTEALRRRLHHPEWYAVPVPMVWISANGLVCDGSFWASCVA